ncbi:ABC transporter ATP-binding protein [Adlercreutzia equolifaciens]|uniref:ABC transporter ATP-binding protein n=1 Tax=Adlercreutzia equolifaciens TaxID=446660 RepID=UPI0023B14FEB|nr:ABC transporter ATP-binding protein [Adlercreutzia equolifaciens]MDE8702796.1 ABC transporter ATP-binding protein [Adlercreutzia equolifaciens]
MSSSDYPTEEQVAQAAANAEAEAKSIEAESSDVVVEEGHENGTPVSDEVAICFDHVTKTYKLYKNDKQRFASIFWGKKKRELVTTVNANNDLSFEIKKGEAVAFLGENGAGKSTALKMVTGVAYPTKGTVTVNGHVSALLELTAGFDKALTGRENVRLRGKAMGFTDEQLETLIPKTIEFADLGVYIDQPVRMYSSGMKSRLGFGLAVSSDPEILVVDEALAVGDKRFKEKCYARVREIMEDENVTVLFVTHSSGAAEEFCKRGIVLDKGTKRFDGPIEEAVAFYDNMA